MSAFCFWKISTKQHSSDIRMYRNRQRQRKETPVVFDRAVFLRLCSSSGRWKKYGCGALVE
jgi:hypothetical protein